jgi:Cysteine rich repeat
MLVRTLAFVVLLASAGAAYAQSPPAPPSPPTPPSPSAPMTAGPGRGAMQACAADRKLYCSDVERGGGRVFKCLRDNLVRLSPPCQGAVQSMREHRREGAAPGQ